jgi:hypothetical protein
VVCEHAVQAAVTAVLAGEAEALSREIQQTYEHLYALVDELHALSTIGIKPQAAWNALLLVQAPPQRGPSFHTFQAARWRELQYSLLEDSTAARTDVPLSEEAVLAAMRGFDPRAAARNAVLAESKSRPALTRNGAP